MKEKTQLNYRSLIHRDWMLWVLMRYRILKFRRIIKMIVKSKLILTVKKSEKVRVSLAYKMRSSKRTGRWRMNYLKRLSKWLMRSLKCLTKTQVDRLKILSKSVSSIRRLICNSRKWKNRRSRYSRVGGLCSDLEINYSSKRLRCGIKVGWNWSVLI